MKLSYIKTVKNEVKSIDLNINKGRKINEIHPTPSQLWERNPQASPMVLFFFG
jgi:hypothetical protein